MDGTKDRRQFPHGRTTLCRAINTPCRTSVHKLPQLDGMDEQNLSISGGDGPCTLRLAEHIGPVRHDISMNCLRVIDREDLDAIWRLVQPWKSLSLGPGPHWEQLHESTRQALRLCTDHCWPACPPILEIYTDGSAKQGAAGFSVVIVGQWPEACQTTFLGCFGGPVTTDVEDFHYVKAELPDAFNAEVTALFCHHVVLGPLECAAEAMGYLPLRRSSGRLLCFWSLGDKPERHWGIRQGGCAPS